MSLWWDLTGASHISIQQLPCGFRGRSSSRASEKWEYREHFDPTRIFQGARLFVPRA